jgi:hypothetical protein
MMDAAYYREQAERARHLATALPQREVVRRALSDAAQSYDEIAEDLERGALELRHLELMPQGRP